MLKDEGIVRHRGKIEATINNARQAQVLVKQEGSLAAFVWRYEPDIEQLAAPQTAPTSVESLSLSKDLIKLGWKFVGPTTVYAFMQAMGLINDHAEDCVIRTRVERARKTFKHRDADKSASLRDRCSCRIMLPGELIEYPARGPQSVSPASSYMK